MSRLTGGIPRGLADHRTVEGIAYREYVRALQTKYRLGREARPTLKEAGLVTLQLERLANELEELKQKPIERPMADDYVASSSVCGFSCSC